jgi:hypothetical protein
MMSSAADRSAAQSKSTSNTDIYAVMDVVWDMPTGFKPWSQKNREPGKVTDSGESSHAYGTKELPPPKRFSAPVRTEAGDVRIWVTGSPVEALQTIDPANTRFHFNLTPEYGRCTGKKIGDFCAHTIMGAPHPIAAALWFTSGNIAFYLDLRGPAKDHDFPKTIEKLAATLLARADAARSLLAARINEVQVRSHKLPARNVGGVEVVHVLDYADAVGSKSRLDIVNSEVEIKSARHVLVLHIGTKAGTLDGKPISLSFPALRDGPENVYCPVATLKLLGQ